MFRIHVDHLFKILDRFERCVNDRELSEERFFKAEVLVQNVRTCLRRGGNETSKRFGMKPPTLEEYLLLPVRFGEGLYRYHD